MKEGEPILFPNGTPETTEEINVWLDELDEVDEALRISLENITFHLSEDEFTLMFDEQRKLAETMERDSLREEEKKYGVQVKCFVSSSKGVHRQRPKPRIVVLLVLENGCAFDFYGNHLARVVDQLTEYFPSTPSQDTAERLNTFVKRRL